MLSNQMVKQYLQRINFQCNLNVDRETLQNLHQAHMEAIPFENLDIHLGNKINLSIPLLFEKIVTKQRGGFCYELNYLFAAMLQACGFKVSLLSAQVFDGDIPGMEYDHLLLLIACEGVLCIVDVGFGDSFISPLVIDSAPVEQLGYFYKVTSQDEKYILYRKKSEQEWNPQYMFTLTPKEIEAFTSMCEFQQTSSQSNFTKKSVCSIATKSGRLTISNGKFIKTSHGKRSERLIVDSRDYRQLLQRHFSMLLPNDIPLTQWKMLAIKRL